MILNLTNRSDSQFPYLTLSKLINLKSDSITEFRLRCKLTKVADMYLRIKNNWNIYSSIIRSNTSNKSILDEEWNKSGLDIDWSNLSPLRYPEEVELALIRISSEGMDNIQAILEICNALGIRIDYINKDTDSVKISESNRFCTRRMAKYFRDLLIKIPRSKYLELKDSDSRLAIKSGNYYYERK